MPNATIKNGRDTPVNFQTGTVPDVSGSLKDYFQLMSFTLVAKSVVAFEAVETPTVINFWGVIQPFKPRELMLLPEGQRSWTWYTLHADPVLELQTDDVVIWNGTQMRVMAKHDYILYGYVDYSLVEDWTGSGP